MTEFVNLNALWAHKLLDAAWANGVREVVLSPGSRSTPLAIAAHAHPGLTLTVLTDERSAAFFALGQAIALGRPVALVCTSGTAAANYLPAIVEAGLARVPLLVLTADRPPALRGLGAAQTIDQLQLYGHAVRRFFDLPLPSFTPQTLTGMTTQVALATASASAVPMGPVHLNVPFEEPLAPVPKDGEAVAALAAAARPTPRITPARPLAEDAALQALAERLNAAARPLLVAGPHKLDAGGEALLAWAVAAGMPLVADVGADLRRHEGAEAVVCAHADAFLRTPGFTAPDLVVRVGAQPTAKGVNLYLAASQAPTIALQPDLMGRDGDMGAESVVIGDVGEMALRLRALVQRQAPASWLARWRAAEAHVASLITEASHVPDEARAVLSAAAALPAGGNMCLSNSLPVRHADTYWGCLAARGRRAFSFRGANGIDGVTSQALGIAKATLAPTLIVTGDLAALHDLGGLAAARALTTPVVLLVLNNDGGGIFSLLPVADSVPAFEPLFGTPHGQNFEHAAALYGLGYTRTAEPEAVGTAVSAALAQPGVHVVEFVCARAATALAQRAFMARATAGLEVAP